MQASAVLDPISQRGRGRGGGYHAEGDGQQDGEKKELGGTKDGHGVQGERVGDGRASHRHGRGGGVLKVAARERARSKHVQVSWRHTRWGRGAGCAARGGAGSAVSAGIGGWPGTGDGRT